MNLVRPAIIASALEQPFPGWTDSLAAAGGLTVLAALGVVRYLNSDMGMTRFDLIPVDIVSNHILVSTAYAPFEYVGKMSVYNCGSSQSNPLYFWQYREKLLTQWVYYRMNKQIFPIRVDFIKSKTELKFRKMITQDLPFKALQTATSYFGSKKQKQTVAKLALL